MTANYVGVNVTHLCSFVFMGAMISSSPRGGSDRFVMGSAVKTSLGHAAKHGFDVLVRLAGMLKTYNEEETIGYVVDRYGEFVLLKPTFSARNYVLWLAGPLLLLIGGIGAVVFVRRKAKLEPESALDAEEQAEIARLLQD